MLGAWAGSWYRQSFGYDGANRLTSANTGSSTATYSYNGEGVRVGKTVNGTATYLQDVVGGMPHVLVETTGGDALSRVGHGRNVAADIVCYVCQLQFSRKVIKPRRRSP